MKKYKLVKCEHNLYNVQELNCVDGLNYFHCGNGKFFRNEADGLLEYNWI